MKIALAQLNPRVGDIDANARKVRDAIARAADRGARLVVFPELTIIGYPPKDLLLKPAVVRRCVEAVEQIAADTAGIAAIIGYPEPVEGKRGRALHNAVAFCRGGRIERRHYKSLLPTYDVFDEQRYFEPGPALDLAEFAGIKLGVSICEDLWNERDVFDRQLYHDNPIDRLAEAGAQLFINTAASPFELGKQAFRLRLMSHVARKHGLPLIYCNQVGGNDELIFDGASAAFDARGELIAHARSFSEDLLVVDLPDLGADGGGHEIAGDGADEAAGGNGRTPAEPRGVNVIHPPPTGCAAVHAALVMGLRDYCEKCGFDSVVLGLSGGIDSAVSAAVCVAALGPDRVRGVSMPSRYSSAGSKTDAQKLAENLGIPLHTLPIEGPHAAFESLLTPQFEKLGATDLGVTEENIQARCRGIVLMAFSNRFGSLLVTTGNKSEVAVGYCTLYGDMAGGLAVLSDVPKTMVYELARWINDDPDSPLRRQLGRAVIPDDTITKPPSAELKADQRDEDSLPPYDVLDEIIERYVEKEQSAAQILDDTGFDRDTVMRIVRLIDLNEYKRKQMAPGLKITGRAFGFGRRMPIAQGYDPQPAAVTARA